MQRRHDYFRVGRTNRKEGLDEAGFLERQKCAALLHCLETFCRHADGYLLAELGNEKGLRLEVDLAAALARRIEFGRTDAVGVPAADLRFLSCYVTCACHMFVAASYHRCEINAIKCTR